MASTQEYLVSCGTTKMPAHLPVDRTRIPPIMKVEGVLTTSSPQRFAAIDAALSEAEARLGKDCTITYHQHLEEHGYFTRVHVNGNTAWP